MSIFGSFGYNYPLPPRKSFSFRTFPNDLMRSTDKNKNFYTELTFVSYSVQQQLTATALTIPEGGGIRLPIPKKLNDVQTLVWSPESGTSAAAGILGGMISSSAAAAGSAIKTFGGAYLGYAVNPLLFMTFQKPNYKEHSLSWSFTPNTEQESNTLVDIINYLKFNSLPKQVLGGGIYEYPNILFVKLFPDDTFTMRFRPCAVNGVSVDYNGAGVPSFFKNGAPTVVNLTLQLTEIQLWDQTNYTGSKGTTPSDALETVRTTLRDAIREGLSRL